MLSYLCFQGHLKLGLSGKWLRNMTCNIVDQCRNGQKPDTSMSKQCYL